MTPPSDQGEDTIYVPLVVGLFGGAQNTKYDWNVSYAPQSELMRRSIPIAQGKGVGGSSLLNLMLFQRGTQADYDRWPELGADGWGWSQLLPYFRKVKDFA